MIDSFEHSKNRMILNHSNSSNSELPSSSSSSISSLTPISQPSTNTERKNNQTKVETNQYYIIKQSPNRGRGIYATMDIPFGTHIHTAPCILITKDEYESHMKYTVLEHYLFNCKDGDRLLALGHGSLFNHHSKRPNVNYRLDKQNLNIHYTVGHYGAKKGEELCIYYGDKLWFHDTDANANEGEGHSDDTSCQTSSSDEEDDNGMASFLGKIDL